jgi:hypothetical protein
VNTRPCRSCGALILWVNTEQGNRIPLDAKSEKRFIVRDNTARSVNAYLTHFATCPNAEQHRKRQPAGHHGGHRP